MQRVDYRALQERREALKGEIVELTAAGTYMRIIDQAQVANVRAQLARVREDLEAIMADAFRPTTLTEHVTHEA
jgi:hypothetical protein